MNNNKMIDDSVVLGRDMSNVQRALAYVSILIIYFFYCYNFGLSTFTKPTMITDVASGGFGFTLTQTEQIFAVMSFGTIPGTFIFAKIATKIGKKYTLIMVAFLISITTFLPLLSPTTLSLWIASRFMCGLVLGAVFGTAMPLVADMFPSKYRGKLAASLTTTFSLAMIFAGQVYGTLGDANWQILMYTAIIPPIVGAIMSIFFVPNDIENVRAAELQTAESGEKVGYLSMYKGKYLFIGIGAILLSGVNFTAYSSFTNNATTYLVTELGMTSALAGSIYSVQGIGLMFGYVSWGALADKFGRRLPLIGMALCAGMLFIYSTLSITSVFAFYAVSLAMGFCAGYSGVWGAYYTELFPAKFRSLSAGMSFNGGRIISTFSLPAIASLAVGGSMKIIFYVAIVVFILGAILWFFLPETLNKEAEEI